VRLSETYNSEELSSNDILGVGYIKEIITQKSTIQPVAVKRVGMNTNDLEGKGFLSSKSIRSTINNCIKNIESSVPAYVYSILSKEYEKGYYSVMEKLFYSYQSILRMKKSGDILDCAETNEELANRIITAVNKSVACSELIEDVKTKIYSESKIMRSLLMSTLNIKKDSINVPCFTTLLGMNDTGRQLIKQNKKRICIPIITKQADYKEYGREVSESFEDLIKADSIWNLSLCNIKESGAEIKKSPFVL
jgi:predicted nucleotidyltransferase